MENIEAELKELVISTLNLEHLSPDKISTEAPLFDGGLGLDSIDALELGVAIKKKYKVALNIEEEDVKNHFYSVKTLAKFILSAKQGLT